MIDLDPRFEVARQLAAEQQALRFAREQALPQLPRDVEKPAPLPTTSQVQEIGRGGLTGSRQLGRNFEAMLRERPRTYEDAPPELTEQPAETQRQPELPMFVPRSLDDVAPWNPRAPRVEVETGDVNLSERNRERALAQGLPASVTIRAAAEMYR